VRTLCFPGKPWSRRSPGRGAPVGTPPGPLEVIEEETRCDFCAREPTRGPATCPMPVQKPSHAFQGVQHEEISGALPDPPSVRDEWMKMPPETRKSEEEKMSRDIQKWMSSRSKAFSGPGAGLGKAVR